MENLMGTDKVEGEKSIVRSPMLWTVYVFHMSRRLIYATLHAVENIGETWLMEVELTTSEPITPLISSL